MNKMKDQWKTEILDTETAFAKMVSEVGIQKAFVAFADEDAVLLRNNKLIKGRIEISTYLEGNDAKGLAWSPDCIEVSESGDLAYTYGKYTFLKEGLDAESHLETGYFHTVWKRNSSGEWKYVWD